MSCDHVAKGSGNVSDCGILLYIAIFGRTKGGIFKSCPRVPKQDMTSEGLGEVFKGDSADTCVGKFPLVLMGG